MSDSASPIDEFLRAYQDAVFAKDVDAFVGLYADDVRVFDMWGVWSYDGIERWREMVKGWFESLGTESAAVEFSDVHEELAQTIAVAHAFVTYKGISAAGAELRSMQNRLTWILERHQGAWKVVHEHTSAPIDFGSAKVMLNRS
jgi:ketosteroid isomerase-like protein